MFVNIRCRHCGSTTKKSFDKEEFNEERCPNCGSLYERTDIGMVYEITEKILLFSKRMHSLDIEFIDSIQGESSANRMLLFEDLYRLRDIYYQSTENSQRKIEEINKLEERNRDFEKLLFGEDE